MPDLSVTQITELISALGALGTASFGLVDASKAIGGSVNNIGFPRIRRRVHTLTSATATAHNAMPQQRILDTLCANWRGGVDLTSQKAIAKSLIKLHLSPENAHKVAHATSVDPAMLRSIAEKQRSGESLTPQESDLFARFDLILTAMLDEVYRNADHDFCNWTRFCAMVVSVTLALVGDWLLRSNGQAPVPFGEAAFLGFVATPLAPIAKDLSTALASAVNAMQAAKH